MHFRFFISPPFNNIRAAQEAMLPNGNNPSHRTGDVPEITPNGTQHSNSSPIDSLPPDPQPNQPSDFVQTLPEIPPPPTQYQSLAPVSPVEDMEAFVATTQQLQYHGSSYPYGNNHEFEQPIPTGGPYTAYMATDFTGTPDWASFWGNSTSHLTVSVHISVSGYPAHNATAGPQAKIAKWLNIYAYTMVLSATKGTLSGANGGAVIEACSG
ncbi:hypothetical protein BU15DRAFT_59149 [Melanogaster broomeanus]|nr:hypothetical protein BU15DRAFT_59149 [Melanogaster broomeanus]